MLSSLLLITLTTLSSAQNYCVPGAVTTSRQINNFSTTGGFEDIVNLGSGFSTGGYGDFTSSHTVSQSVLESIHFNVNIEGGSAGF